ncbi:MULTISPECIES: DHA2 family efflux MFS transporter permease subunit [Alphaproteobacteria]|uniref:MFS transporter n=2 Tax=Alphaproteobacteria TaxID=28211 RepID=A0A512HI95_9HYPH|nr:MULTISPECIES: DHA2 family efflux MFS transporter permease subunit [Alphaproteobacteria]GEO85171.1 MFS transporter [Ciceribacter naphthalenivorans]GLR24495.1 MFS transporter [Ciceribacter naphthalenivorans]GLT07351.1 MFS transporter [Sphingomonas psychrolutea]
MNRIVPLILAVALFMEQMDSTVIATALPAIAADLGVGPITLKLALTSYMVALAIFIPVSGWMADRHGAKKIFRIAILVFVIGSILCAVASSLPAFVAARFLQGMGGAMMTPVGRLVLLRTTKRSELVSAMALLTIPALVGPLTGPPVGGFITTYFSWHWIFLINAPIGIVGIWLATLYLPAVAPIETPPIDLKGFVLSGLAASGVVFGLSVISLPALPIEVGIGTTVIGLIATALYVRHARRHDAPLLALGLFGDVAFRVSALSGSIFRIATGAVPFLMPLMLQLGFGMNPFESGLVTFIGALGAITTKFMAKRVFAAAGFRKVLTVAATAGAATTAANAFFTAATPIVVVMGFLLFAGFCRSFFFTGINTLAYSEIDDRQVSQATSMSSVLQQISLALGVAVAAAILEAATAIHGRALSLSDFHIAFGVVAALSLLAVLPILRLTRETGAAVSGHRLASAEDEVATEVTVK